MNLNKEFQLLDKMQELIRSLFAIEKDKQSTISTIQLEDLKPETQNYLFTSRKEYEQEMDNCDKLTKECLDKYVELKKELTISDKDYFELINK